MGFSRQEYWSGLPFSSPGSYHTVLSKKMTAVTLLTYYCGLYEREKKNLLKGSNSEYVKVFQHSYRNFSGLSLCAPFNFQLHENYMYFWRVLEVFIYLFYWSIVDLQYCVNFRRTAEWFSHIYIHCWIIFHYILLQDIEYSSMC